MIVHTNYGDYMINYYDRSKKEFKKYIKENPYCTKEEWDNYAHKNNLFSAFTLECHEITNEGLQQLVRKKEDVFEFLKSFFIIIPPRIVRHFKKIIEINKKVGETDDK